MVDQEQEKENDKVFKRECIYGGIVEETTNGLQFIQAEIIIENDLPVCVNKKCNDAVSACGYKKGISDNGI